MTQTGRNKNKLIKDEVDSFTDFNEINLMSLLENTNRAIWAVDRNSRLIFGNSIFHKNYRESFNSEIKVGESIISEQIPESYKKKWKGYFDRALKGERFSFELESELDNNIRWNHYNFGPVMSKAGECIGVSIESQDITLQKKMQQELLKNKERFEGLVELLPEAIFEIDTKFNLTYVNQRAKDLFGYSQEDISNGLIAFEMIVPEQRDLAKQNFAKRIKGEESGPIEYKAQRKDGSTFPVLFHAKSIFENGTLLGARGIIVDITGHKNAEEKEKRMAMMLDVAPNSITIHDLKGNFLYANQKSFELHGYTVEEFLALNLSQLDSPESSKLIPQRIKMLLEKGEASFQVEHIKKDGSVLPLEIYTLVTKWGNENVILSVGTDITSRKQHEKLLIESEKKFKNIFNNSLIGISVTDIAGRLRVNKAFSKIVGYSEDELNNVSWIKITHPDDVKKNQKILESILKGTDETARWEKRYIHKNGKTVWVDISTTAQRDKKGKPEYFITSVIDITERKRAEMELNHFKELFSLFMKHSPIYTFIKEVTPTESRVIQASENFSEMIGIKGSEMTGKTMEELFPKDFAVKITADDWDVVSKGKVLQLDEELNNRSYTTIKFPIKMGNRNLLAGYTIDITEQKLAEEELRSSQQILEGIFNTVTVRIFWKDKNLKYLGCNQAFAVDAGFSDPKDIIGKDDFQLAWKEQANIYRNDDLQVINSEIPKLNIEESITTPKRTIMLLTNKIPLKDYTGEISGVLGTYWDITEWKKSENELVIAKEKIEESEKKYRGIYNNLPVGIFRSTLSGKILSVNPSFLKIYGFDSLEEVQKTHAQHFYLSKSDREKLIKELKEKLVLKDFVTKERKKDGSDIWVETNYSIIKDEKGEIEYIDGILVDITARVEAENKVAEYRKRLQISLKATHATVFENNLKTGELICTPEIFHHFGYETEMIPATFEEFSELIHPDDITKVFNALSFHIEGKSSEFYVEYRIKDAEGNWRWVDAKGSVASRDKNGNPKTLIGISRDISDRKKVELELIKAKEKAEESDRLKSAFLANMSHEIRTPMNGILGFADLLKEPQLSGEEQQKYIQIIEKSGSRMLNTINNIIDISKIEAGQMQISFSNINIPEQFENIVSFFTPEADKKGISFIIKNLLKEKDFTFYSDREKLYAILTNLVKNALKYCHNGSIELGSKKVEDEYEFYVKDSGKGIPEERQQAIFERFIQADIHDREALQGSGLGLAISKSYIEMLGGKIWLKSEEGIGSTFYFTIPMHIRQKDISETDDVVLVEKTKRQTKKLKVLIAEDDPVSETLIKLMIDKVSSETLTAKDGAETIKICRNHPGIDLILMDMRMPEIDGYETTKKIREFNNKVVIIAQTAFALTGDREKALNAGCNDYISKPISQTELHKLINKYFA